MDDATTLHLYKLPSAHMLHSYDSWTTAHKWPWRFPECVARVPVSLWGCGVELCSPDFAFTSATVRNRPQPSAWGLYGRACRKFCKRGPFWSFPASHSFISRGRRVTSWHSNMLHDVSKVVLCGRRNTFATFSEDALHFSWQAQHFGHLRCHFAWQAQHFRRMEMCQGCVKRWKSANSVESVAFLDKCWKLTEASHETSILTWQILRFMRKLVGKRPFFRYKVWKVEEVSYEMLVLSFGRV